MLSQSELARVWGPPCTGRKATVSLHGTGKVTVRAQLVDAVKALNNRLIMWNYRTIYSQTGAYVCRLKVGGSGWSNHSYGTAIDINWQRNPYGPRLKTDMPMAMVNSICAIRTNNGKQVWNWGGFWSGNKDAMHFEIVCSPADIATGIRGGGGSAPAPQPPADAAAVWAAAVRARAREVLPFIQASPNLDGNTPYSWHTIRWQQALNLVTGAKITEDGIYGPGTMKAVANFQAFMNAAGANIKDFPGAAHEGTRWWMATSLQKLAA